MKHLTKLVLCVPFFLTACADIPTTSRNEMNEPRKELQQTEKKPRETQATCEKKDAYLRVLFTLVKPTE